MMKRGNRRVCTPEQPWQEGDETPVEHPLAFEYGEQMDGWPCGDVVRMKCPTCGTTWTKELAQ